ncbi:MAG: hypothetical protein ABI579_02130 [Candidatus Sumerlaeota bacterium]
MSDRFWGETIEVFFTPNPNYPEPRFFPITDNLYPITVFSPYHSPFPIPYSLTMKLLSDAVTALTDLQRACARNRDYL